MLIVGFPNIWFIVAIAFVLYSFPSLFAFISNSYEPFWEALYVSPVLVTPLGGSDIVVVAPSSSVGSVISILNCTLFPSKTYPCVIIFILAFGLNPAFP